MSSIFYLISSFPAMVVNFGLGNVPSRYISFILIFQSLKVNKKDIWLIILLFIAILYPLVSLPFRPFHLLDVSYVLGFVYLVLGITIVRKNPNLFKRFIFYFWIFNIVYAISQNILLIIFNGDTFFVSWHENIHLPGFKIPEVTYLPYLYRVSGFFVESAPFVIYLMFTHLAFTTMGFKKRWIAINLFFIFLAGAKIGLAFLVLLFVSKFPLIRRVNIIYVFLVLMVFILLFIPIFLTFISENRELSLGSIYVRLTGLVSTVSNFAESWQGLFMGHGYVSSTEIMQGVELEFKRGIDFFSTFIVSNGVLGSFLLLTPLIFWIKGNSNLSARHNNIFNIAILLALLTMGSLLNFQYAYLMFILAYLSEKSVLKKDN